VVFAAARAASADDLSDARFFDHQGALQYQRGRYREALALFERSYARGGPPIELWNMARCHLKLEEPGRAAARLKEMLAREGVSAADRREAEALLDAIRRRPSLLVVSVAAGAAVELDGRPIGRTPLATEVGPGSHVLVVTPEGGGRPTTREIVAANGEPIVVEQDGAPTPPPPAPPTAPPPRRHPVIVDAGIGLHASAQGQVNGSPFVHAWVAGSYAVLDATGALGAVGIRLFLSGDAWDSRSVPAAPQPAGCATPLPVSFSATELGVQLLLSLFGKVTQRLRLGGQLGIGFAGTTIGGRVGGDLYEPSCAAATGLVPVFHAGLGARTAIAGPFSVTLHPFLLDVHPAYAGARTAPVDASGAWVRFGFGLAAGFEL
jgi:hypothetical protein